MDSLGKVIGLYVSKKDFKSRIEQNEVFLDENGVVGDKYYGKNKKRSVLITSNKAYKIAKKENVKIEFGNLGENILVNFDLERFLDGSVFEIGESTLQMVQNCTICNGLSKIDKKLPKLLEHDRGVFAKIIKEGKIKQGDKIKWIK